MAPEPTPDVLSSRLGYLLKHAYLRLTEESARTLRPYGIDGRELAVLAVLSAGEGLSQLEAASRLDIDRTTMVALLDTLESRSLVTRRRSPHDRRRNLVLLTPDGRQLLADAEDARRRMEQDFLSPLPPADATRLISILRTLVATPREGTPATD